MPNHIHIILVSLAEDGLRRTFATLRRRQTVYTNALAGTAGHLGRGRYGSVVKDETLPVNAVRYASLNPVCTGLVNQAQ